MSDAASATDPTASEPAALDGRRWLTRGVSGTGLASLFADAGHEVPTALLPTLLTSMLHVPAAALGVIEGAADGLAGVARLAGGALADEPRRRRAVAVRWATGPSVIPGLLAAVAAFEVGNVAATLLILRATELLTPGRGAAAATTVALVLYTGYNLAATIASVPAGRVADRIGARGPVLVLAAGVALFAAAYTGFALTGPVVAVLALPFIAAGAAIGCVETAEHAAVAALAAPDVRGSAFGLLATVQAAGNLAASAIAGLLWTAVSPAVAFGYLVAWMLLALGLLLATGRR
jgi:MFS family permease